MLFETPHVIILANQRSGTKLLSSCLASHPDVHERGECVFEFLRSTGGNAQENEHYFRNYPKRFSTAIVMYDQVTVFEHLCGPILGLKIIHLVRNPSDVALSIRQMQADRIFQGDHFKAHFHRDEEPPSQTRVQLQRVDEETRRVAGLQKVFLEKLKTHRDILTITYEELTAGGDISELSQDARHKLLGFLGLPDWPLTTNLRKGSEPRPMPSSGGVAAR